MTVELEDTFLEYQPAKSTQNLAAVNPAIESKQKEDCTDTKPVPKIPYVPE